MNFINKHWRNLFRSLLLLVFIICFGVNFNSIDSYRGEPAAIGMGVIAAAALICLTLVELFLWNDKKK